MEFRNKEDKRVIVCRAVSLSLLFAVVVFVLVYVGYRLQSLAWFASGDSVEGSGMAIVAEGPDYEILIDRTAEYDDPKYDGVSRLKAALSSNHFDLAENSTETAARLGYELRNEVSYSENEINYKSLTPGSCGTMTFYLKPLHGDIDLTFDLSIGCYVNRYGNNDTLVTEEVTDPTVLDLLRGHILFFTERTGNTPEDYKYSGLLYNENASFSYDTSTHTASTDPEKAGCYEITLYWEWVMTYDEIAANTSANGQSDKKYPSALSAYIAASPQCFFATNQGSSDPAELNDGYNDGDQTIGDHANYIVAYVTPRADH